MRGGIMLAAVGTLLVLGGIGFAERSWGWTYALAALGAVMVVVALIRFVRESRTRTYPSA